ELVPVGGRAAEADDGRVVGIHIGGAPTGEQPVVRVAISACVTVAGEHVIDPEVVLDVLAGTVGHICVEDSLQLVSGGGVHRQLRHGFLLPVPDRVPAARILPAPVGRLADVPASARTSADATAEAVTLVRPRG